jgi:hypothetical protein
MKQFALLTQKDCMKRKLWHCCLALLSPLFLYAQGEAVLIIDTFLSPVTLPFVSFETTIKDNKKVLVQWQVKEDSADYFTIERSAEGKTYEAIGIIKATEGIFKYEFADELPSRGQAYYRIRYTGKNGNEVNSQPQTVILPGASFFRFYPNPADKLLILRADCPVEVQIVDGFGKQRISKSLGVGPQIIDVSFLEKGVYILRITDKNSGRQQFDKFLKN